MMSSDFSRNLTKYRKRCSLTQSLLASLQKRGNLRQLEVISQKERIDAWTLDLEPDDKNVMMPGSKQAFYV